MNYWDQLLIIAWLITINLTVIACCSIYRNCLLAGKKRPLDLDEIRTKEREKLHEQFANVLRDMAK